MVNATFASFQNALEHDLKAAAMLSAEKLIVLALAEDLNETGDLTSRAMAASSKSVNTLEVHAQIIAKAGGVIAGGEIVTQVFKRAANNVRCKLLAQDGDIVTPRRVVVDLIGPAETILTYERTALNFLQRLSGVATLTRKFVDAVAGTKAVILDTRKTTPGWRVLEKYAVRCGGGQNHRMGLYDMFLIKENHIAAAGGITAAVENCRAFAKAQGMKWRLEVEAKNLVEVEEGLVADVDQIMLDNMSLEEMRQAVQLVAGRVPLEASGNVNLERVRAVAETGVDYISVGSLTHSAPAMDFSLLIEGGM